MNTAYYAMAAVAIVSALLAIAQLNAVHALLYLIITLMSTATIFFLLGAPFAAAIEIIIYAGAIMVLFIFVVMMLNLGHRAVEQERRWLPARTWPIPLLLAALLLAGLVHLFAGAAQPIAAQVIDSKAVGAALFGPYMLGVEMASVLLLAGLVGAYHLGRRGRKVYGRKEDI